MALTVIRVSASSSARFSVRLWVGGWLLRAVRLDEDHLAAGAFEDGNVDVELVPELLLPLSEGALGGQDEEPVHLTLVDAGLEQYSGLNRLAQPHLVGDEKPVGT